MAAISGAELSDRMFSQALEMGAEGRPGGSHRPWRARARSGAVETPEGDYLARAVILATGARHRRLGVEREEGARRQRRVLLRGLRRGLLQGQAGGRAGGGDSAVQDALLLSNSCSQVYIIHRRGEFRAESANVDALRSRGNVTMLMDSRVTALLGAGELTGVRVEGPDGSRDIEVDALFVAVGSEADSAPFAGVASTDAAGWFTAGEDCAAGAPGLFAAGDCRAKSVRQLTTGRGRRRGRRRGRLPPCGRLQISLHNNNHGKKKPPGSTPGRLFAERHFTPQYADGGG